MIALLFPIERGLDSILLAIGVALLVLLAFVLVGAAIRTTSWVVSRLIPEEEAQRHAVHSQPAPDDTLKQQAVAAAAAYHISRTSG